MKHLTCHYKKQAIRSIKIAILAVIASIFFMPSFTKIERTGQNMFTVSLNGVFVGVTGDYAAAEKCAVEARRRVASESDDLVFMESNVTVEGQEVLWGAVDSNETIVENMVTVLRGDVIETLHRSYIVKIKEDIINLGTLEDVDKLLQAAINSFDSSGEYGVALELDADRELPVLVAKVDKEEVFEEAEEEPIRLDAGFDMDMRELFETIEPDREKDFSEYELGIVNMNYGDSIEIVEAYLYETEIRDIDEVIVEYTKEEAVNEIYTVVSGDTLSGIAIKTDTPMEDLIAVNASLEDERSMIHPGDELIITVAEPKLEVVRQEEMYYEEDYDADVIYIDNDSWYTTDKKVLQQPSAGHRKVVAVVTFENDKEVGTEIVKEEITFEPIPKVVERGTKIPPSYIKPVAGGRLTSTFGPRKRPKAGASSNHRGVDWAVPTGTPVVASCGGTVIKAGWGSGYGYCVYIQHPDGKVTRYGHLSKVLVSAGQSVSQGQRIALSGNTGVSTGPHLHFEILIGGSQVNPLKYLN